MVGARRAIQRVEHDAATVEACRRGDRAAIERVLMSEAPRLERLLARMVGDRADVEDLLQEVFVAALDGFTRFRGQASVATWLSRIAVCAAMDHLRRPHRRERATLRLVAGLDAASAPGGEGALDERRALERLDHHLAALSPKNRIAFVLHVVEGMPMAETAALMGSTLAAAKTRVFLARRALLRRVKADPLLRALCEEGA